MRIKSQYLLSLIILIFLLGISLPLPAQQTNIDWETHSVGEVKQVINNAGTFDDGPLLQYPFLFNTQYPRFSFIEHIQSGGWFIGGVTPKGDTLVSVTTSHHSAYEFPGYSTSPWDTVFQVLPGQNFNIASPEGTNTSNYWKNGNKNYTARSDQDLITRYNDYNQRARQIPTHDPLYLDVRQISYSWGNYEVRERYPRQQPNPLQSSHPLESIIIARYEVTPTRFPIENVYLAQFVDPNIKYRIGRSYTCCEDDKLQYLPGIHAVITSDSTLKAKPNESAIGSRFIWDNETNTSNLQKTFLWGTTADTVTPSDDNRRYQQMSSGVIMSDSAARQPGNRHYILSAGPFDLTVEDTLSFNIALVLGKEEYDVQEHFKLVEKLHQNDYHIPQPPPAPNVRVTTRQGQVTLKWGRTSENYPGTHRLDGIDQPFEGYRVYKREDRHDSWTLLREFDIKDNNFGNNFGLSHQFTDTGLNHSKDYFYSVTAFSKKDTVFGFPSRSSDILESQVKVTAGPSPSDDLNKVAVVPNPYRADVNYHKEDMEWEQPPPVRNQWLPADRRIQFINLPTKAVIKIYTLSGQHVRTIQHASETKGYHSWNLTNEASKQVSSGIYLYMVKNERTGKHTTGKFVIIL